MIDVQISPGMQIVGMHVNGSLAMLKFHIRLVWNCIHSPAQRLAT